MLTPEQISQARNAIGLSAKGVPTSTGSSASLTGNNLLNKLKGIAPVAPAKPNLGDYSANVIKEGVNKIGTSISGGASKYQQGVDEVNKATSFLGSAKGELKAVGGLLESGLGSASGFLQTLFSPLTAVSNQASDKLAENPIIQKISTSGFGDAIAKGEQGFNDWATAHPELATNLSDALNVGLAAILGGKEKIGLPDTTTLKSDLGTLKNAVVDTTKATATKITDTIKQARILTDAKQIDNLAGTIVQGKTTDILKAQKALSSIDTTGIKTYSDLTGALDEKITNLSNTLDQKLATNTTTKPLSELNLTSKVGEQTITHNYVKDAITQLKEHFTAVNDIPALEKLKQLEIKATQEGLSVKEINDLAKLHGQTINAFNANGQAAAGLTKQAAENTRSGLKATARDIFNDPLYKATDTEISGLIRTRDLVNNVAEKVTQLQQRVTQRGWGEKIGRLVFQVADKITGGGLKGFIQSFVPRGEGLKIMNALDLEKALNKNLTKLQSALEAKTEAEMTTKLNEILKPQASEAFLKSQPTTQIVNKTPKTVIPKTIPEKGLKVKGEIPATSGQANIKIEKPFVSRVIN